MFQIEKSSIQDILFSADIVDYLYRFLPLKKSGSSYTCCCPFHEERTPSFHVSATKQIFKCFGCGKSGSVISFAMEYEKLSFTEAVVKIAEFYNIPLKYSGNQTEKSATSKKEMLEALQKAAELYHEHLKKGSSTSTASQYVEKRGLKEKSVALFKIGWAPNEADFLYKNLKVQGFKEDILAEAGLIKSRENGTCYDFFRNRLTFPIHGKDGKIIAFSCRSLDPEEKTFKYLNSPDTPVFYKNSVLFGLWFAKEAIEKEGYAIIVEGNLDVISLHQAGVNNVVAPLGTSITENHLKILKRYVNKCVLLLDGDEAGRKSVIRKVPLFIHSGLKTEVANLPDKEDPDSFIRKNGKEALLELLANKVDLLRHYISEKTRLDSSNFNKKEVVRDIVTNILKKVTDPVDREYIIQESSNLLQFPQDIFRKLLLEKNEGLNFEKKNLFPGEKEEIPPAETNLLKLSLFRPKYIETSMENGLILKISSSRLKNIFQALFDLYLKNPDLFRSEALSSVPLIFLESLEKEEDKRFMSTVILNDFGFENEEAAELSYKENYSIVLDQVRQRLFHEITREMVKAERDGNQAELDQLLIKKSNLYKV